ncbi:MAG: glycosyltransferase [Chloroflexota bacterium]
MKISAFVVVYNEERRLRECLNSLKNFDELLVVDLGSRDRSTEIARGLGITVIQHKWVPIVEMVLPTVMPGMRNDWIIRVDPDEVLPSGLVNELNDLEVGEKIAIVAVPYQYYFLNKKLDTTVWGGIISGGRVINRNRMIINAEVHQSFYCKDGYEPFNLPFNGNNAVQHYWIDSYSQLFSKHERYLGFEGQARYKRGATFSWEEMAKYSWWNFKTSFIVKSGWRGGWNGWFLSFFYALYEARAWLSLRRYEKTQ